MIARRLQVTCLIGAMVVVFVLTFYAVMTARTDKEIPVKPTASGQIVQTQAQPTREHQTGSCVSALLALGLPVEFDANGNTMCNQPKGK